MTAPWFTLIAGGAALLSVRPWWAPPRRRLAESAAPVSRRGGRSRRRLALVALVVGGLPAVAVLGPVPVVVVGGVGGGWWYRRTRTTGSALEAAVTSGLPEVTDLVRLGVAAGLTPRAALERTQGLLPGRFAGPVGEVLRRAQAGESFAVALDRLVVELGAGVQPLVSVLAAGARGGGAVATALQRVSDDARHRRRVAAQERARRLPVTMLLPLVLCVLPAFVLVGVVPLVLASLRDLRIGG